MTDERRRGARAMTVRVGGLAAFVVLSAGCGIQPTAVVDAGTPPSMAATLPAEPVNSEPRAFGEVYFVRAGTVTPVSRPNLRDSVRPTNPNGEGVDPITLSMQELLSGPSADEAAVGIRSELPRQPSPAPLLVNVSGPNVVQVVMPMVAEELSPLAVLQITCTVRAASPAAGLPGNVVVQRRYDDGRVEVLLRCPSDLGS